MQHRVSVKIKMYGILVWKSNLYLRVRLKSLQTVLLFSKLQTNIFRIACLE